MKKLIPKLKIHPLAVTAMMTLLLFFGNALRPTQAETTASNIAYPFQDTALTQQDGSPATNLCAAQMADFSSKELADFRTFLDTNFQNKSSTTSLVQVAIAKYSQMQDELNTAYGKYLPNQGSALLTQSLEPDQCQQIINQTLSDAKILFKDHAIQTSGVKKSTALLQKYQEINSQLAGLYQQFVYMKAYLDSFAGKLPCYSKNCVKG